MGKHTYDNYMQWQYAENAPRRIVKAKEEKKKKMQGTAQHEKGRLANSTILKQGHSAAPLF